MDPDNVQLAMRLLPEQLGNTLYMVFASTFFAILIGLPMGVILTVTNKGHIKEQLFVYKTLEAIVNAGRSFPFAILMVALLPLSRVIVGTSLGTTAAIVPLSLAAAPFLARLIETCLNEVDKHILEAVIVMGSSPWQIITKVLLKEALASILSAVTLTMICLVGYSAMAGLVGGGGLGQVAIDYGYYRFNTPIMIATVVLLLLLVQSIQWLGGCVTRSILKKRGN
jgi:D-methionine transport system permease protein